MDVGGQAELSPRQAAKIHVFGFPPIACTATEISESGAMLIVVSQLGIPETFELEIAGEAGRRRCAIVRKAPHKIRVRFQ
jgi:hypothetical protein